MNEDGKNFLKQLGQRIKKRREALGMAQDKFAFTNGLSRSYYTSVEQGRVNVSIVRLREICQYLNTDLITLLQEVEK